MIVKMDYADCKGTALKVVTSEGKEVNGYMRVRVTRDNILEAIAAMDANPRVVAFQFEGCDFTDDMQFLASLAPVAPTTPILYSVNVEGEPLANLTADYFGGFCEKAPSFVRVVFKCPEKFCDMGVVYTISTRYPNSAFCGGYYLRIPGANIGCVRQSDIRGRALGSLKPTVTGCGCVMATDEYDNLEIIFSTGTVKQAKTDKPKTEKSKSSVSKPKRATVSLFALGGDGLSTF